MVLTSREYWIGEWKQIAARRHRRSRVLPEIRAHLPRRPGLSFFEVGCAPGGILADYCRRFGYVAHGIDYAEDPARIEAFLRDEGVRVGRIHKRDFFSWNPPERYDIVASFGFIEHFENPEPVADRHFALVRPGGRVILSVPNFAGAQRLLRWIADAENLGRHNTRCMSLAFFRATAVRNRARLLQATYAGGHFGFWIDEGSWLTQQLVRRSSSLVKKVADRIVPGRSNPWFSPYLVAVFEAAPAADA
jgi:2-polyprenyl-3-methyl-5-hydroxy-6-metoxy-1,4-benzoquinol methylase